jgi:hypothetical protein
MLRGQNLVGKEASITPLYPVPFIVEIPFDVASNAVFAKNYALSLECRDPTSSFLPLILTPTFRHYCLFSFVVQSVKKRKKELVK